MSDASLFLSLTLPISRSLVSITTMVELCSHSILQKSSVVSAKGPCVAMYAFCCLDGENPTPPKKKKNNG